MTDTTAPDIDAHTPEPWRVQDSSIRAFLEPGFEIQIAAMATTSCGGSDEAHRLNNLILEQTPANALLMVAAPALLRMLRHLAFEVYDMETYNAICEPIQAELAAMGVRA